MTSPSPTGGAGGATALATADLARLASELTLDDVPARALEVAEASILDTLAVALAARDERIVAAVSGWVEDEGGEPRCSIWGRAARTSPARAALANGTAAHALDFDDVCWAMNAHPSAVLLPAALAAAEAVCATGVDLLLGYVTGFEIGALVGASLGRAHYAAGWHPTATVGTLAATVAVSKILGLDAAAIRRAIGIACSEAAGSRMSFGTDTKPLHAGLAGQAGVVAASLAARGVTACEEGVEGPMGLLDLYGGTRESGGALAPRAPERLESFALVDPGVELKPYPSCRFTHRVIDAVLALRARHPGATVESIECVVDPFALRIVTHSRPRSGLEAKFSMEYCAAVAWIDGWPGLASFSDDRAARRDVQELLSRVSVCPGSAEAETATARLAGRPADSETVAFPKGSPQNPMSRQEHLAKVRACGAPALGAARVEAMIERVGNVRSTGSAREIGECVRS